MSNIKTVFIDQSTEGRSKELSVIFNQEEKIAIIIEESHDVSVFQLDINLAIKFSKELRKVIGEAKSFEY